MSFLKELRRLPQTLTRISHDLRDKDGVVQRYRRWAPFLDAQMEWIIRNSPAVSDLNQEAGHGLMKFTKGTWMPLGETHFPNVVSDEGAYQLDQYHAAMAHAVQRRVALDIGANIGLLTRPMSLDFERVHAFEPQSAARACIPRNAPSNNITIHPFGLGEFEDSKLLGSAPHCVGGAAVADAPGVDQALEDSATQRERIEILPLDSFGFEIVDFIKIDVQGYEAAVLRGARKTLQRCRPVIMIETVLHGEEDTEATKVLQALEYKAVQRVGKDTIFIKLE